MAPGIALWCLWLSIFSGHEDIIVVEHPGAITKKFKGISMAMGLPSSSYLPVRSFVSLFINKHGKLDEHSKNQCCDCWAYHEMVSTFFFYAFIFFPCQQDLLKQTVARCPDASIEKTLGTSVLQQPASPPILQDRWQILKISDFGPKVPVRRILFYDERCAAELG